MKLNRMPKIIQDVRKYEKAEGIDKIRWRLPAPDEAWDRIVLIEVFPPRVEPTNCLQRANTSHIGVALHRMRSKR